jgi:hypothetical protein
MSARCRKAIAAGMVFLPPDGLVDVEASGEAGGEWHLLRIGEAEFDPETEARIDAELAELNAWTERVIAEVLKG